MGNDRRDITVITGASEGIGRALARVFAAHGHDLALVARSRDRLEDLATELRRSGGPRIHALPHDLLDPHAPAALAEELEDRRFDIDILVNNAGVMEVGRLSDADEHAIVAQVQLNVLALTALTRRFLPQMVRRGRGRILNVASTAGFQAMPGLATYAATKAYVLSFSEGLAEELRGEGITVTALAPGLTETHLLDGARTAIPEVARLLPDALVEDPATVAEEGYSACMNGEVVHVPGLANRAMATLADVAPRAVIRRLAGLVGRRIV